MNRKLLLFLLTLLSAPLALGSAVPAVFAQPQAKLLMASPKAIPGDPYFEEVIRRQGDQSVFERAKIEYLIERVRASHFTFVRNREDHTAREAANHLSMKWYRAVNLIHSARNFINYIASNSSFTGQPYLVKFKNGHTLPARDMLTNELDHLEFLVAQTSKAA